MSQKLLVKDARGEREFLLIGTLSVGRDPRCDVSDADPLLSRRHAEFLPTEGGVVVRDLNSRNGMLVNGRKVMEAVLQPGDVVQIGRLAVTFVSAGGPTPLSVEDPAAVRTRLVQAPTPRVTAPPDPPADDRTALMTPSAVAAAVAASARAVGQPRNGAEGDASAATQVGEMAAAPLAPPPGGNPPEELKLRPAGPGRGPVAAASAPSAGKRAARRVPWAARVMAQVTFVALVGFGLGAWSQAHAPGLSSGTLSGAGWGEPAAMLALAIGAALAVSANLGRSTFGAVQRLVSDLRRNDGANVADPWGAKSGRELADTINEILARGR